MLKRLAFLIIGLFALNTAANAQQVFVGGASNANIQFGSGFSFSVNGILGARNLLGPIAVRGDLGLSFDSGGGVGFGLAADFYYPIDVGSLDVYFGAGLGLGVNGGTFGLELRPLVGIETRIAPRFALFAEFLPKLLIVPGFQFNGQIRAGLIYYF
jgi:hypothetical protein